MAATNRNEEKSHSEHLSTVSNEKLLICAKEIEEAAEDVLSDRHEIVDLDRKRNQNREALRALDKSCKSSWKGDHQKTWLAMSNCFFKVPASTAKSLIQKEQHKLDCEINDLRNGLKNKVNNLMEKEGRPEVKGFQLQPLNKNELMSVLPNYN